MLRSIRIVALAALMACAGPALSATQLDGVTLRVLSTNQPWDVTLQKLSVAFTEETGAKVEFDLFPFAQTVQKVAVELATKSPTYDLMFLESDSVARFAASSFLIPVRPLLDNRKVVAKDVDLGDFLPSIMKAFTYNNMLYGLPHFAATQILYYRPDLLKKAGLEDPPKTWADFLASCAKLQAPGKPCTAMRGKPGTSENIWYWTQIFYGYGGSYFKNFPSDLTPTINSLQAVEALTVYAELLNKYGIPGSVSASYDEVVVAMQQGNIAIAVEGAPLAGRILDPKLSKVVGKLGFAVPPAGPKGRFAPFAAQGYGINGASKNKEAAAAFIAWSTSKETMKKIALESTYLAVTRGSIWKDKEYRAKHDYDFGFGSFATAYEGALREASVVYRVPIKEFREIGDRVGTALQEAVVGKRTPQQALDGAQKDVEALMKRAASSR